LDTLGKRNGFLMTLHSRFYYTAIVEI